MHRGAHLQGHGICPDLEHEYELMLGAVERSHAAVGLRPNAQILEFAVGRLAGGDDLAEVTPDRAKPRAFGPSGTARHLRSSLLAVIGLRARVRGW